MEFQSYWHIHMSVDHCDDAMSSMESSGCGAGVRVVVDVGMPLLVGAAVKSPLEVLVVPLKVVVMSLQTTVIVLPLEVMAILFLFVGVAFLKDAVVCT